MVQRKRIVFLKSVIRENDVLDETTGHMFREVDGDIVEYKYCPYCKEWHPVENFGVSRNSPDGLQGYCKKGGLLSNKMRKNQQRDKQKPVIVEPEETTVADNKYDKLKDLIVSLQEEEGQKDTEIARLQKEKEVLLGQAVNLDALNESDIKRVLANNDVPMRILFETIANKSGDRYRFYAIDEETGMTLHIKIREEAQTMFSR